MSLADKYDAIGKLIIDMEARITKAVNDMEARLKTIESRMNNPDRFRVSIPEGYELVRMQHDHWSDR